MGKEKVHISLVVIGHVDAGTLRINIKQAEEAFGRRKMAESRSLEYTGKLKILRVWQRQ
jgi:translation elongation factor EF-1alpha